MRMRETRYENVILEFGVWCLESQRKNFAFYYQGQHRL